MRIATSRVGMMLGVTNAAVRLRHLLLLLLWPLWLGTAHAGFGKGSRPVVQLYSLKPSQMEIGKPLVNDTVDEWRIAAKKRGMTLTHFARTKLTKKFAKLGVDAIIDPAGAVRPTDGHHRIAALIAIAKETGVEVPVRVKIRADYRGLSQKEFAKQFFEIRGSGYFTRNVQRLSSAERVKQLPDNFEELRDSPMRSAMDGLFIRTGLDELDLGDYAEFKVADWLIQNHIFAKLRDAGLLERGTSKLPDRLIHDPKALNVMRDALSTPEGRAFISGLANGKHINRTRETIVKLLAR